ncbi:MAG: class I SAM-dependent methyltransferase [Candidatus Bathyarchaeota archaeon]|nr:class I SAM-dependent methyltransferase [Candidatus Bathyarchaeota archaeon]
MNFGFSIAVRLLTSPIFWGGTLIGYYSMYGMGHFEHGWFWVVLGIIPIIGLAYSISPLITRDVFNRQFVKSMGLKGHERVLEFGCGDGRLSKYLVPLIPSGHLTCIDIDAHALGIARKRLGGFSNVDFVLDDIRKISAPVEPYDAVVIQFVLHDVLTRDRAPIVEALVKWLRKGGVLYVREPREFAVIEDIQRLLKDAGFTEVEASTVRPSFLGVYYGSRDIYQSKYILGDAE